MALDFTKFVNENFPDIRRYCIWDLSRVLFRCVEHSEKDISKRKNIDEITAEEWIDKSPDIVKELTEKYLVITAYNKLADKLENQDKQKIDIDNGGHVDSNSLNTAKNSLSSLNEDEFAFLIPRDFSGPDYRERFLGRDVWDKFYQPLQKYEFKDIVQNEFLVSRGYTKTIFW